MIKLHDLNKVYRTSDVETTALNQVNLEVDAGEFIAIMGPSGCGKSTLLNVLGMLDSPDGGSYSFAGENVAGMAEWNPAVHAPRTLMLQHLELNRLVELVPVLNPLQRITLPRRLTRKLLESCWLTHCVFSFCVRCGVARQVLLDAAL